MEGPIEGTTGGRVAPIQHTVGLLVALLALSVLGAVRSPVREWSGTLSTPLARPLFYLKVVILQWLWVGYVWIGLHRSGISLRALLDESRWTTARWFHHLAIGIVGFILWLALGAGLGAVLHPRPEQLRGLQAMLPQAPLEGSIWAVFALSAAVCEEVVYRGYLLRQFRALTGSTLAAVFLQAAAYGSAHLVLPIEMVVSVGLLGVLLGALAAWRKSLVPGMILHAGTGLVAWVASGR